MLHSYKKIYKEEPIKKGHAPRVLLQLDDTHD
jgi:hypothetical protein